MEFQRMDLSSDEQVQQAATILMTALKTFTVAWPDISSALREARSFLQSDRLAFLALEDSTVIGWIGAIRHSNLLWELHPLVVHPSHQHKGVGKALIAILEAEAHKEGVSTIYLGTDDEIGATNIFGKDLYPDVLAHARELRAVTDHPYRFYHAVGYTVIGLLPDVGGPGKHDILMAKRIT